MKLLQFAEGKRKKVRKIPIERVWLHIKYPTEESNRDLAGREITFLTVCAHIIVCLRSIDSFLLNMAGLASWPVARPVGQSGK